MGSQPAPAVSQPKAHDPVEERGLRGLPPFVDVVYGAVFGYGVYEIAQAVQNFHPNQKGNATPLLLLIVASIYLLFDYAQARMFTEKHPYRGLTRFTLDILIAVGFTFAYIAARIASPNYLFALAVVLVLSAWWVDVSKSEYSKALERSGLIIASHLAAAAVLMIIWAAGFIQNTALAAIWTAWVNKVVGLLYLLYCIFLTLVTAGTRATEIERSLLPIIPLYGPWRHIKVRFNRHYKL